MHWQRQYLHPMLKAFDAPSREECTVERPRSCTAPAALVLLNDPSFVEATRAFAARILQHGGTTVDDRLNYAFRIAVSRDADTEERTLLAALLNGSLHYYENADAANKLLSIGLTKIPGDLDPRELAAWTIIARAILNLNEVTMRN